MVKVFDPLLCLLDPPFPQHRRVGALLCALAMALAHLQPEPVHAADPLPQVAEAEYVAVANARVREQPNTRARQIASLLLGDTVRVVGRPAQADWLRVRVYDGIGYVYAPLLEPVAGDPTASVAPEAGGDPDPENMKADEPNANAGSSVGARLPATGTGDSLFGLSMDFRTVLPPEDEGSSDNDTLPDTKSSSIEPSPAPAPISGAAQGNEPVKTALVPEQEEGSPPLPSSHGQEEPSVPVQARAKTSVRIRAEPNTTSAVLGALSEGQSVDIVDSVGDWLEFLRKGRPAYAYAPLMDVIANAPRQDAGTEPLVRRAGSDARLPVPMPSDESAFAARLSSPEETPPEDISVLENEGARAVVRARATTSLRIRMAPNTDSPVLGALSPGEIVTVVETVGDWLAFLRKGETAYVYAPLMEALDGTIQEDDAASPVVETAATPGRLVPYRATANARVRSQPSVDSETLAVIAAGGSVSVFSETEGGDWLRVRHAGLEGYVYATLLEPGMNDTSTTSPLVAAPAHPEQGRSATAERTAAAFQDCSGCPEMVELDAGSFVMGSPPSEVGRDVDESPQHTVFIGSFALGRYELTRRQWAACVADGVCRELMSVTPDDAIERQPRGGMSWEDAHDYLGWLSDRTGQRYRFPSEAEWEYAARAGTSTARPWGGAPDQACRYANVNDITGRAASTVKWAAHECDDGHAGAAPIGSFSANAFGLFDMLGNLWEWTEDCWNKGYQGAPDDGSAWTSGNCATRVVRGGAWDKGPSYVRSANRNRQSSGFRSPLIGLRVARDLE